MHLPGRNWPEKNGLKTGPSVAGFEKVLRDGHGLWLRLPLTRLFVASASGPWLRFQPIAKRIVPRENIEMRPNGRHTAGASQLPALRVWAICLLLLSAVAISPTTARAAPSQSAAAATTHVYLLRGVLNIFSLGLDTIGARLQAQGMQVTVANFVSWSSLADEAAADYRAGRVKTIILVGHSSGATALPDMIAKLNQLGVPVKLAIGLDSVFKTRLSTGAERYINIFIGDGPGEPVRAASGLRGKLDNVDVRGTGVGHISIDKSEAIQRRVIAEIDAAIMRSRAPAAPVAEPGAPRAPRQARSAAASAPARN